MITEAQLVALAKEYIYDRNYWRFHPSYDKDILDLVFAFGMMLDDVFDPRAIAVMNHAYCCNRSLGIIKNIADTESVINEFSKRWERCVKRSGLPTTWGHLR